MMEKLEKWAKKVKILWWIFTATTILLFVLTFVELVVINEVYKYSVLGIAQYAMILSALILYLIAINSILNNIIHKLKVTNLEKMEEINKTLFEIEKTFILLILLNLVLNLITTETIKSVLDLLLLRGG